MRTTKKLHYFKNAFLYVLFCTFPQLRGLLVYTSASSHIPKGHNINIGSNTTQSAVVGSNLLSSYNPNVDYAENSDFK